MISHANSYEFEAAQAEARRNTISNLGIVERGFFVPLVRMLMRESKPGEPGGAFVFTSATPREGVSSVTAAVARELTAVSGARVLVAEASAIGNFVPSPDPESDEPVIREASGIYRLRPASTVNRATRIERFQLLDRLRDLFTFVLIDCPALSGSAEALEFGARSSGIVLVAAAGQIRRSRLQLTKRMIDVSGVPLLGCALNRRTYPIPDFLYNRL